MFTALLLLIGLSAFSQSIGYFRYDSVRFEKVGGNSEFILLNSTRDSIGVLFNMGNGRTRFRTMSSLGISPNVANGITKSGDTLILGDSLNRATKIFIQSRLANYTRFNGLQLSNDTGALDPYPYFLTYNPSPFGIKRVYRTSLGDIDSAFYGGNISTLFQLFRDSTDTYFGAGKRNELLMGMGGEFVGQYYPPRDTTVLKVGRDGQSGNLLFGQFDLGNSWGYNINVVPPTSMPSFPISVARTAIDLSRVIDNTRRKKMTGAGISGYTSMYKSYQNTINMSTYETGSYTDSIFGYKAYGDAYPFISQATKAKTLAVWTVKNAFGVYIDPQYRYTNTVDNGYSLYARGDSDILVNKGFAYLGPSTSPVRQNNTEGLRYRLHVTGKSKYTDSVSSDGIVKGYGLAAFIPAGGSDATLAFGNLDSTLSAGVIMQLPSSRDARHLAIRVEGFSAAAYPDQSNGMYIRFETGGNHANVSRISRNGNWTLGNSSAALAYRYWKKLAVDGGGVFRDTLRLEVAPLVVADTVNYKAVARHITTGDLVTMPWMGGSGGGGGGGTIAGSIALNQVAFGSGANAIQGNSNFTYNGSAAALTSTSGVTVDITGATGSSSNYAARFTGRVAMGGVTTPFNDLDVGSGGISAGSLTISTAAGSTAIGNFSIASTNLLGSNPGSLYQYDGSTNSDGRIFVGGTGATQIGVGRPYSTFIVGASTVPEASSGNHPFIGSAIFLPPTITTGAATVTDAATVRITGPTTVTVSGTNSALLISSGNLKMDNGSISLNTAGNKLNIATGSNASIGVSGAMTAGTITISTTAVTASSKIFLTHATIGGTPGVLSVGTITAGTSFVINSSSGTDTGSINWWIIN